MCVFKFKHMLSFTYLSNVLPSGGMIAPVLGGSLLIISRAVPVFTSAAVFVLAGICVLLLRVKESARNPELFQAH